MTKIGSSQPFTQAQCPICGKATEERFRPFCSKRCADVDLHRWLSGVYAMPVKEDEDEDGEHLVNDSPGVAEEPNGR